MNSGHELDQIWIKEDILYSRIGIAGGLFETFAKFIITMCCLYYKSFLVLDKDDAIQKYRTE